MSDTGQIRKSLHRILWDASAILRQDFDDAMKTGIAVEEKHSLTGLPDFVSNTDRKVEAFLKEKLHQAHPDIAFVGEESGGPADADRYFMVDPLDGTSNFVSLRNYFGICAAYVQDGDVLASAVADPVHYKVLSAVKGEGVFLNDLAMTNPPAGNDPLRAVQLECELTFSSPADFDMVQKILPHMSGLRKSGSIALDLSYLAEGRKTLCLANHLQPYDIAAPLLIAREAGCVVTDLDGNQASMRSKTIMAGRPAHHAQAISLLRL